MKLTSLRSLSMATVRCQAIISRWRGSARTLARIVLGQIGGEHQHVGLVRARNLAQVDAEGVDFGALRAVAQGKTWLW
jgi:hypothetical protein